MEDYLNLGPTSLMVIARLRPEFGFASSYIISLQQDQFCPDYIYDYLHIGPTPLIVLARLRLEFVFASLYIVSLQFRSYLFDGYCKIEAIILICFL